MTSAADDLPGGINIDNYLGYLEIENRGF